MSKDDDLYNKIFRFTNLRMKLYHEDVFQNLNWNPQDIREASLGVTAERSYLNGRRKTLAAEAATFDRIRFDNDVNRRNAEAARAAAGAAPKPSAAPTPKKALPTSPRAGRHHRHQGRPKRWPKPPPPLTEWKGLRAPHSNRLHMQPEELVSERAKYRTHAEGHLHPGTA
eukprot:5591911-Amphidinium_carterae.4